MLKDLDLLDHSEISDGKDKIRLAVGCKKRLMSELSSDVAFLSSLGVMDYSLLVSAASVLVMMGMIALGMALVKMAIVLIILIVKI